MFKWWTKSLSTIAPSFFTATIMEWKHLLADDFVKNIIVDSLRFLVNAEGWSGFRGWHFWRTLSLYKIIQCRSVVGQLYCTWYLSTRCSWRSSRRAHTPQLNYKSKYVRTQQRRRFQAIWMIKIFTLIWLTKSSNDYNVWPPSTHRYR